jgi:glucoamylase
LSESLDHWLARTYDYAARTMLHSVSRTELVKTRPGFDQTVRPVAGAIVASPVIGAWDPDPDYFFHWYRDSAMVIDALRLLYESGDVGAEALAHLADFVRFSTSLQALDGRMLVTQSAWRSAVAADHRRFLRDDAELAAVHGDAVAADVRVNPDGTLDISRWSRPQYDGAPLRALALLRWTHAAAFDPGLAEDIATLIRADLALTAHHWDAPGYDIWEEEQGSHYYVLCVSAAALDAGADWLHGHGGESLASVYRAQAAEIRYRLDAFWLQDEGHYRSRILPAGRSAKELDISVVLAAIHAKRQGAHSPHDPRIHATLDRLDALFDAAYPINRDRHATGRGPALGRYPGDRYYSGGAYYFSTLGAAELCYRAAAGADAARAWGARGDAYLATVRAYTPASGELSEQFDQATGAQASARHLAWSYAALITCAAARRAAAAA